LEYIAFGAEMEVQESQWQARVGAGDSPAARIPTAPVC